MVPVRSRPLREAAPDRLPAGDRDERPTGGTSGARRARAPARPCPAERPEIPVPAVERCPTLSGRRPQGRVFRTSVARPWPLAPGSCRDRPRAAGVHTPTHQLRPRPCLRAPGHSRVPRSPGEDDQCENAAPGQGLSDVLALGGRPSPPNGREGRPWHAPVARGGRWRARAVAGSSAHSASAQWPVLPGEFAPGPGPRSPARHRPRSPLDTARQRAREPPGAGRAPRRARGRDRSTGRGAPRDRSRGERRPASVRLTGERADHRPCTRP
jgi:hypothetical protein